MHCAVQMCFDFKVIIALLTLATVCNSHGALLRPTPRFVENSLNPVGFEAGTVFEFPDTIGSQFVCRSSTKSNLQSWNAGDTVQIQAQIGVPHPGQCEMFLSYDTERSLRKMRWFKIGNWKDCGTNFDTPKGDGFGDAMDPTFDMFLPNWLPSGNAVFRFMWSAVHNTNPPEYYVDCADVRISSSNGDVLPEFVVTYPMISQSPWRDGINLWLSGSEAPDGTPWSNPQLPMEWVCGPPCADRAATYNQCPETAPGTEGYIDICSFGNCNVQPNPPTSAPSTTQATGFASTAAPTPSPSSAQETTSSSSAQETTSSPSSAQETTSPPPPTSLIPVDLQESHGHSVACAFALFFLVAQW